MTHKPTDKPAGLPEETGLRKGLTSYGDQGFSLFLRKAFIKGAGYTDVASLCSDFRADVSPETPHPNPLPVTRGEGLAANCFGPVLL